MRRKIVITLLGVTLVLLTAGACAGAAEDCDAEDYRNRERECGFTDVNKRKSPSPTVKLPSPTLAPPKTAAPLKTGAPVKTPGKPPVTRR